MDFNTNFKSIISYFMQFCVYVVFCSIISAKATFAIDADNNVFFIKDIEIYAESDSLHNAKNEALIRGTKQAFTKLMQRILPKEQWWKIDEIANQRAHLAVKENFILSERMTARSYRARVSFLFDEVEVRRIVLRAGGYFYDKYSVPHILIPFLKQNNRYVLWQDANWNTAWDDRPSRIGLFSYVYLMDDIRDVGLLKNPESFINTKLHKFVPLLERYNAEGLVAVLGEQVDDKFSVTVRIASRDKDTLRVFSYTREKDVEDAEFYKNIATDVFDKIDSIYKGYDFTDQEKLFETELVFNFENRKEWQDLKVVIGKIKEIKKFEVIEQNDISAKFRIVYNIDPTLMGKVLFNNSINIVESNGILSVTFDSNKS